MSKKAIQEKTLTNIANAIRSKKKTTDPILLSDFATEISNLPDKAEVTPNLTGFDIKKAVIQSAFTGFANEEEKNLWYMLFNAQKDMARTIEHLSVDFELDCGNFSDLYTSDIQNMIQAVDAGVTCIVKNLVCNQIEPVVYASLVESSVAGNLKILSGSMYGGEVVLTKSIAKWCSSLILDSVVFGTSVIFNLTNCGFDSFQILNPSGSEITLTGVNTIKKFVAESNTDVVYNFPQLFMPTNSTELEEVDIAFDAIKIGNLKQTFKNATYKTGFPTDFNNTNLNNTSLYESFMTSNFLTTFVGEGTIKDLVRAFYGCTALTSCTISGTYTAAGDDKTTAGLFYGCTALTSVNINLATGVFTDIKTMFSGCTALTSVNMTLKTSTTDFSKLLYNCSRITEIVIKLSDSDGNKIKPVTIEKCVNVSDLKQITKVDLSNVDFSALTNTQIENCGLTVQHAIYPNVYNRWLSYNQNAVTIWPDEIKFEALTSDLYIAFVYTTANNGSNFIKNFVSSNYPLVVGLNTTEYDKLTKAEREAFTSLGNTLERIYI